MIPLKTRVSPQPLSDYERMIALPEIMRIMLIIAFLGCIPIAQIYLLPEITPTGISVTALILILPFLMWLNKKGYHRFAGLLLFVFVMAVLTYNIILGSGLHDAALIGYPVVLVYASLIFGKRYIPWVSGAIIALTVGLYSLTAEGVIVPLAGTVGLVARDGITVAMVLAVTGVLLWMLMSIVETNVQNVVRSRRHLETAYNGILQGWAKTLEFRDVETEGHSRRVTGLSSLLAAQMGVRRKQMEQIKWGALLHDIGKIGIPDDILLKPGSLTEEEREKVRTHPGIAVKLLANVEYLQDAMLIPRYHHERWDGSGYPEGLKGEAIPFEARLFAVVDVYDALTSKRPYSPAWKREDALAHLNENSGILFDPQVIKAFNRLMQYRQAG